MYGDNKKRICLPNVTAFLSSLSVPFSCEMNDLGCIALISVFLENVAQEQGRYTYESSCFLTC